MAVASRVIHHHHQMQLDNGTIAERGLSSSVLSLMRYSPFSRSTNTQAMRTSHSGDESRPSAHVTPNPSGTSRPELMKSGTHALAYSKAHVAKDLLKVTEYQYKPWEDEEGNVIWSPLRAYAARVILDKRFETLMICVILFNLGVIIYESDQVAKCYPDFKDDLKSCPTSADNIQFLVVSNYTLLVFYIIEAVAKMCILRLEFFRFNENLLDVFIVAAAILAEVLGNLVSVSWLRILRVARLFRTVQIVSKVPELYMLIIGFKGSMKAMFFGAGLLLGLLSFFSILLVQLIHPINVELVYGTCDDCHQAFSTVALSTLTLFQQIVAGDSWGIISVPIIKHKPSWGLLLPFVQIIVGVGAMNLILAVVVDRAQEARDNNKDKIIEDKVREAHGRQEQLLQLFKELDADQSGNLQLEEIRNAFKSSWQFQKILMLSDITEDELYEVFKFCDRQGTGDVSYLRLCRALDEIQAGDMRKTCMISKMYIHMLADRMNQQDMILRLHRDLLERIDNRLMSRTADLGTIGTAGSDLLNTSSLSSRQASRVQQKHSDRRSAQSVTFSESVSVATDGMGSSESSFNPRKVTVVSECDEKSVEIEDESQKTEKLTKDEGVQTSSSFSSISPSNRNETGKGSPSNGTNGLCAGSVLDQFQKLRFDLAQLESQAESTWRDTKRRTAALHNQMNSIEAMIDLLGESGTTASVQDGSLEEQALCQFSVSLACLQSSFLNARHSALVDLERDLLQENALMSSHRTFLCSIVKNVGVSLMSGYASGRVRI